MRQLVSLLCLGLTFTTVFSDHSEDHHHHDEHEDSQPLPNYPIVIPGSRISKVHSAEVTEIGNPPPPSTSYPQWGGPTGSSNRGDKFGNDIDPNYQYRPYKGHSEEGSEKRVETKKAPRYGVGLPRVQKYGYPPHCVDIYPKDDISIENTQCKYMVVITLRADFKDPHKDPLLYAHFKLSRRMTKEYGYVAVGLSKDEKMDDDHIVECVKSSTSVHPSIFQSWSNYHSLPSRLRDNSDIIKNKTENFDTKMKILTCEFDRPMVTKVEYSKGKGPLQIQVFDLTKEKYYILMAVGETAKPDSYALGMHGLPQEGAVSVFSPDYYRSSALSAGHGNFGILTIFITLLFASIVL